MTHTQSFDSEKVAAEEQNNSIDEPARHERYTEKNTPESISSSTREKRHILISIDQARASGINIATTSIGASIEFKKYSQIHCNNNGDYRSDDKSDNTHPWLYIVVNAQSRCGC